MRLTGHQPNYLPYPGFFSKILLADIFIIVDHVEFTRKSEHKRNKLCGPNGPYTKSLNTKSHYKAKICDVTLVNQKRCLDDHWKSISHSYSKHPFFPKYGPELQVAYSQEYEKLVDLNETIIRILFNILDIDMPIYKSSNIVKDWTLKNNDMIIHLCNELDSNVYISGPGAVDYILPEKFKANGINHFFDFYEPISYQTPYGISEPNMSVIDAIFSIGPIETINILKNQHQLIY